MHKVDIKNVSIAALPLILLVIFALTFPFSDTLGAVTICTSSLSPIQRSNIDIAVQAVDGKVLKPGEEFSFNRAVGPRTAERGYRPAPSYLGPESPRTVGGGVCLVSSAIYQTALRSGMTIEERVPHLRTIKTVPAGLDATVWYGQADLRFKNTSKAPVQIVARANRGSCCVSFVGRKNDADLTEQISLRRVVTRNTVNEMIVEVFRQQGTNVALISRDHYSVAR